MKIKNDFLQALIKLTTGSCLAQIITVLSAPVMTRLYTTEQIGNYTLVLAAVGMFGGVVCTRYDMSIVYEEDEERVNAIIILCACCSLITSCIIGIAYAVYYYLNGFCFAEIVYNSCFVCVLLLLTGVTNILISYNNRSREYGLMASMSVIRSIAKNSFMIAGGFCIPCSVTLILSQMVGTISGAFRQAKTLIAKTNGLKELKNIDNIQIREVARKHKKQPIYSAPAIFVNNFSYSSINYFISFLFGTEILGLYSISYRLLGLPMALISNNISRVYLERATELYNTTGNYRQLFKKTFALLLVITIPITLLLVWIAPQACALIFGKVYYSAGIYVRILAPMFGIRFVVSPLTVGILISNKQNIELLIQIFFSIGSVLAFFVSKLFGFEIITFLFIFSIVFSVLYIVYFVYLFYISKGRTSD